MSSSPNDNAWLVAAIDRAKDSMFVNFAAGMAVVLGVEADDVVGAVEAALLAVVTHVPSEEGLRTALRSITEPYAAAVSEMDTSVSPLSWETVADAIIAMLEAKPPDPSTWALDSWNLRKRK